MQLSPEHSKEAPAAPDESFDMFNETPVKVRALIWNHSNVLLSPPRKQLWRWSEVVKESKSRSRVAVKTWAIPRGF